MAQPIAPTSPTRPQRKLGLITCAIKWRSYPAEQVHRAFAAAVIDEADSILIDEARIPLVIAGGSQEEDVFPLIADPIARQMRHRRDFTIQENSLNVSLTDAGLQRAEHLLRRGDLYAPSNLALLAALQNALHAHALLPGMSITS